MRPAYQPGPGAYRPLGVHDEIAAERLIPDRDNWANRAADCAYFTPSGIRYDTIRIPLPLHPAPASSLLRLHPVPAGQPSISTSVCRRSHTHRAFLSSIMPFARGSGRTYRRRRTRLERCRQPWRHSATNSDRDLPPPRRRPPRPRPPRRWPLRRRALVHRRLTCWRAPYEEDEGWQRDWRR